jgi:L-2-hydroxyglutarate oxidase LhgO
MTLKIVIIGGGWYGCYSALLLQDKYDVILIEKNDDIFKESSYYNQNRLHLGYHYSRNFNTRNLCKNGFNKFFEIFEKHNIIDKK